MAKIVLTDTHLRVQLSLKEKVLALHSSVEVSLLHVTGVDINPPDCTRLIEGNERFIGTDISNERVLGVRHLEGVPAIFCDVYKGDNAVGIRLNDTEYQQLVVETEEPAEQVAQRIRTAVQRARERAGVA